MRRLPIHMTRIMLCLLALAAVSYAQVIMLSPEEGAVTSLHHIAVTIVGKAGAEAKLYVNQDSVARGIIRVDGVFDFLNISVPDGPVELRVEARGALNRTYIAERKIHVLGPPQKIFPYEKELSLPADGTTTRELHFEIQDEWGYRLTYLKTATATLTTGEIITKDLDPKARGVQLPIRGGQLELTIKAPQKVGEAILEIDAGGRTWQLPIKYTTPIEPFILVGSLAGGVASFNDVFNAQNQPYLQSWRYQSAQLKGQDFLYGGRAAFYAKGTFKEKYRLTASYDSHRNYRDQYFQDIDPDMQYPLYGDASTLTYDAQTRSQLFVKVERNESYLTYGDFNTGLTQTEFTAYNRTFNGLITNLRSKNQSFIGFATLTDREITLDEIRGEGISGYYYLSNSNVTMYSEKITIQVRDRYHSEKLLNLTEMTRFQDYTIDYVDGALMFKQPVPSLDPNGNPVYIVVSYECKTGRNETLISGIRYSGQLLNKLQIGGTYISEERNPKNYQLYGFDVNLPVAKWLAVRGEWASASSPDYTGQNIIGRAYKAEFNLTPFSAFNLKGYYRNVDSSFSNTSQVGGRTEQGSQKYGTKGVFSLAKYGTLSSEFYKQYTNLGTPNENNVEVLNFYYEKKIGQAGLFKLGYEEANRERSISDTSTTKYHSELIRTQLGFRLLNRIAITAEHDRNLSQTDPSKPTATALGVSYDLTKNVSLFAKYRILSGAQQGTQTILGFDSKVSENTQLLGKYEIGSAIGENRNRASIGLKNKWKATKHLTFNFAYENATSFDQLETPTPEHQAASVAFEYLPDVPWKSSGKYEYFTNQTEHRQVVTLGADFRILSGLSAIAKTNYFQTDYIKSNNHSLIKANTQLGLALRPEKHDYFNLITKTAWLVDKNTHVVPTINNQRLIISTHAYWQPLGWLELGGRYARRIVLEEEGDLFRDIVTTDFYALRAEFDFIYRWSLAIDNRYLKLMPLDQSQLGSALEVNYLIAQNMQLGLGYILKTFTDQDFVDQNYQFKNFYLTMHLKFSEDIFNWK